MAACLFTFQNQNTGEFADILAPNESAARLWLGGDWMHRDIAPLWASCEVGGTSTIIGEAQRQEREAHAAMVAANPIGKERFTTSEALAKLREAEMAHRKTKARVEALIKISADADERH